MSSPISVLPLNTYIVDASGTYDPVFLSVGSSIVVEKDASTPTGDNVNVTFGGISLAAASSISVQSGASLTLSDVAGINVLANFNIGSGSTLTLAPSNGLTVDSPINFVGPNASLVVSQTGLELALINPLTGFDASDTIDFRSVPTATSAQYATGMLTLYNGSAAVASVPVTGSFSSTTLEVAPDGMGGISVGDNLGAVNTRFSGSIADYTITSAGITDTVQDHVTGRDLTQITSPGQTLGFADGVAVADPNGVAETITHLYQTLLGRAPDLGGLVGATNAVDSGTLPYASLGAAFFNAAAPEFAARYGSVTNAQFVNILEQNTGGSGSDPAAQVAINQLNAGVSRAAVTFVFAESANGIAATSSYSGDAYGSQVYRMYETTLGRAPDASGNPAFISALLNGATPSNIAQSMLGSSEFSTHYGQLSNSAFVTQIYQNALGRAPDPGSQNFINALNAGTSRADVAVAIGNSAEARADFASATHDGFVFLHS